MQSQKYNRTYHFPFSPGTTSDDRIQHNWTQILQHELVMTEKLDGENTCLKADGVYARSHSAPTRSAWSKQMWDLWELHHRNLGELEIFGESLYAIHSIEYTRLEHYFYIFAIRYLDKWLSWDEVCFYAATIELPTVPMLYRKRFTASEIEPLILTEIGKGSQFGGDCEGFVFRNVGEFAVNDFDCNVLKYVRKNHVKTDEHWTKNWKRAKLYFEQTQAE